MKIKPLIIDFGGLPRYKSYSLKDIEKISDEEILSIIKESTSINVISQQSIKQKLKKLINEASLPSQEKEFLRKDVVEGTQHGLRSPYVALIQWISHVLGQNYASQPIHKNVEDIELIIKANKVNLINKVKKLIKKLIFTFKPRLLNISIIKLLSTIISPKLFFNYTDETDANGLKINPISLSVI